MRVTNVLVVDDEAFVVDYVVSLLDMQPDMDLNIFHAYSYAEASALISAHRIDLLVSDIRMPDGNGLSLAEQTHRQWPYSRVLMLSAYAEFDFAKRAIQNDVDGYILKTEPDERILGEVKRVLNLLDKQMEERQRSASVQRDLEHYRSLLHSQTLLHWLHGDYVNAEQLQGAMRILDVNEAEPCYLAVGRITSLGDGGEEDRLGIRSYALRTLAPYCRRVISELDEDTLMIVASPKEAQCFGEHLSGLLEIIAQASLSQFSVALSFAVSPVLERLADASAMYWSAMGSLRNTENVEEGFVYRLPPLARAVPPPCSSAVSELSDALGRSDRAGFLRRVQTLCEHADENVQTYRSAYYATVLGIMDYLSHSSECGELSATLDVAMLFKSTAHGTPRQAMDYLCALADRIFERQQQARQEDRLALVESINRYIAEHISEDVSLDSLAARFGYNASYLSRMYAQQSGMMLKRAIMQKKLDYITLLMRDQALTLNDVAERSGFHSRAYFNAFIKRICGMNPSQYRAKVVEGE